MGDEFPMKRFTAALLSLLMLVLVLCPPYVSATEAVSGTDTPPVQEPVITRIAANRTPVVVYSSHSLSSTALGALAEGQIFTFTGTKTVGDALWYSITYRDKTGWVNSAYVTPLADGAGYTMPVSYLSRSLKVSSAFTLRTGPGTGYASAGSVSAGKTYTALGTGTDSGGITWFAINHNGETAWIKRTAVKITNNYTAIPNRNFSAGGTPVIYLSPSNQTANPFSAGGTSEGAQMTRIAKELKTYLEQTYVCTVYLGAQSTPISRYGRPMEAYRKGTDVYLAIHSNAHGSSKCYGAQGYYFPGCEQSRLLASNLCAAMNAISPYKPNVTALNDGMIYLNNIGYGEAREPGSLGMISLLFELEFHDHADTANWIINNTSKIAVAIGDGIADTIGMRLKGIEYSSQAQGVTLSAQSLELGLSKTASLSAVVPSSCTGVKWTSSNPKVATVSRGGVVTAIGCGECTITLKGSSGSAACKVSVKPELTLTAIGAGIRLTEPYGIRFGTTLSLDSGYKAAQKAGCIVEYGTVLARQETLGDATLTLSTPNIIKAPAKYIYSQTSTTLTYTAVMTNIPTDFFDTGIVARGYLIYKDVDGTKHVIYSEPRTRSFREVARLAYDSYTSMENPSANQLRLISLLEGFIN